VIAVVVADLVVIEREVAGALVGRAVVVVGDLVVIEREVAGALVGRAVVVIGDGGAVDRDVAGTLIRRASVRVRCSSWSRPRRSGSVSHSRKPWCLRSRAHRRRAGPPLSSPSARSWSSALSSFVLAISVEIS
jgi:hypothetical protein